MWLTDGRALEYVVDEDEWQYVPQHHLVYILSLYHSIRQPSESILSYIMSKA